MRYDDFSYLWPPRPETAISRSALKSPLYKGWVAQAKKNGTCNVIAVSPEGVLKCMSRHNDEHKLWVPTAKSSAAFQNLPGTGWYVFVAELMHSKVTTGAKDTNYIHDILVADGDQLIGVTFKERQQMLADLFLKGSEAETISHYVLDSNAWLAKNFTGDFEAFFAQNDTDEDEGIVLKNPRSQLAYCFKEGGNAKWQVKSRRPHKNYSF